MTKNRTVDDRNTIRGLVQTKEFYIHVKHADARARETPEIDWRGRVYVGRVQALAEAASLPNDADPNDIYLTDSRGDHTGWVLLASRFETITGLPRTSLAKFWETGPEMPLPRCYLEHKGQTPPGLRKNRGPAQLEWVSPNWLARIRCLWRDCNRQVGYPHCLAPGPVVYFCGRCPSW